MANTVLQFFPEYYTLSECLNLMRIFFPVGLTLLISMLDFTLDSVPENADDPLAILRNIKSKQEVFWQEAKDIRDVLKDMPEEFTGDNQKEYWKTDDSKKIKARVLVLQKGINEFAENDLCKLSQDVMNMKKTVDNEESMCVTIIKYLMSGLMFLGVL